MWCVFVWVAGVDLSAMYDNEWVDKMRTGFFNNPDLPRVLGDDKVGPWPPVSIGSAMYVVYV